MALTKATYSMIKSAPSNVVDLGADSTGVGDSLSAFQIAGASASSVYIPDGTFSISANIPLTVAKSFTGNGKKTLVQTTAGFGATPIFTLSPPASTDPKNWRVSDFGITNAGSATSVFKIDLDVANKYVSKLTLKRIISNAAVSTGRFVELSNAIPNLDGLFTSVFEDNWSYGGYYLDNVGDSVVLNRNTTTGSGVGYYVNQLGTAANIAIRDGNCTSAGGGLNQVKGANLIFEGMQVECPSAFTGSNNAAVSVYRPSGGSIYNTKILNNSINTQGNPLYCVYLNFAVQTIIDGNELYCDTATGAHIFIDTDARDTIIGNNKYYSRTTGLEVLPIITNNGIGTVGVWNAAAITLAGWTSQGTPAENALGFFKDRDGTVQLRGRVAGAAAASGSVLFTLPVGFRPNVKAYQISAFGAVAFVRGEVIMLVESTGTVKILTNNATSVDLNNFAFNTR
jgi:hypothetical protein